MGHYDAKSSNFIYLKSFTFHFLTLRCHAQLISLTLFSHHQRRKRSASKHASLPWKHGI